MKAFAEARPKEGILQQVVAKLPWGHNIRLLEQVKDPAERLWYAKTEVGEWLEPKHSSYADRNQSA